MIERNAILDQIRESIAQVSDSFQGDAHESLTLIGSKAPFSSIELVSILIDIEQEINSKYDTTISLMDEKAMSQRNSPFRSVGSLVDYIYDLVNNDVNG